MKFINILLLSLYIVYALAASKYIYINKFILLLI